MPTMTPAQMSSYRRILGARDKPAGHESLGAPEASLSPPNIQDRVQQSRETLLKLLESLFGPDEDRKVLVERLVHEGGEGLRMLADRNGVALGARPFAVQGLEAIVRTDGSRPSFLVKDGDPDRESSPLGAWGDRLTNRAAALRKAIAGVGRIDTPGIGFGYQGTGFLVGPNLILTNRHVLQLIATPQPDGGWKLFDDAAIDFGHEFKARDSVDRRRLKSVLFWGSREIDFFAIDHSKLDVAVIELEPAAGAVGGVPFVVQSTPPGEPAVGRTVVTIGYPGEPVEGSYPLPLLDQLFRKSFGYKRLAPGETMAPAGSQSPWTVGHDATTLGGNSGSVVLSLDSETIALGLHYGGRPSGPAVNWGHRLDLVLGQTGGRTSATLYDVLRQQGATFTGAPAPAVPPPPAVVLPPVEAPAKAVADWKGSVTLQTMRHLSAAGGRAEGAGLEAPGDGETPAAQLADRTGYDPNFLAGFPAPFPFAVGSRRADMRELRVGGGVELKYEHFSVVLSAARRMPMATACNINGAESRSLPRLQQWSFDGRLSRADQWGNELYSGNGLDKGHQVRREDPVWGPLAVAQRANADTFHYTNSCPQMAVVNQQTWAGLENYVLTHTKQDAMRVSVFTGPFFTDNDLAYRGALVPRAFWKVVAFLLPDGRPSATAYKVAQDRELLELEFVFAGYKTFQISVQQVADGTGLDFSALIPFDGFSQHERVHGTTLVERIDRLEQIRV